MGRVLTLGEGLVVLEQLNTDAGFELMADALEVADACGHQIARELGLDCSLAGGDIEDGCVLIPELGPSTENQDIPDALARFDADADWQHTKDLPVDLDKVTSAPLLRAKYGTWGEHGDHPRSHWLQEAADQDTNLGYWEWVANKIDQSE